MGSCHLLLGIRFYIVQKFVVLWRKPVRGPSSISSPRSVYRSAPSLFEQLEEEGIAVSDRFKYFPYWATYDIEAMQVPQQDLNNTEKLEWTVKHVPASVSLCSNAPEFA